MTLGEQQVVKILKKERFCYTLASATTLVATCSLFTPLLKAATKYREGGEDLLRRKMDMFASGFPGRKRSSPAAARGED